MRNVIVVFLLVALSYPLFFHNNGLRDLWSSHEARAAQNAVSVIEKGYYGVPELFSGKVELQKPPLYYWAVAALAQALNRDVDATVVRLPPELAGLGTVCLVYILLSILGRPRAALWSALMLATMVHFTWTARVARIDMPLTFAVTLALGCIYLGYRLRKQLQRIEQPETTIIAARTGRPRIARDAIPEVCVPGECQPQRGDGSSGFLFASSARSGLKGGDGNFLPPVSPQAIVGRPFGAGTGNLHSRFGLVWLLQLMGYISMSLAVMLKGPVGAVLPILVLGTLALVESQFSIHRLCKTAARLGLFWGLPLVGLITGPWFMWLNDQTDGQFFETFFIYHNLQRGLGGTETLEAHPWWLYLVRLIPDLFPWSLCLPIVGFMLWRNKHWCVMDRELQFGLIWAASIFTFLSLMSFKRADYLVPAYPGFAIAMGAALDRRLRLLPIQAVKRSWIMIIGTMGVMALFWPSFVTYVLPASEPGKEHRTFAGRVRELAPPEVPLILFRMEAHALSFHLGKPFESILEWENLEIWANDARKVYVLMPMRFKNTWAANLPTGKLYPITSNSELAGTEHEKPYLLLCNRKPQP